MAKIFDDFCLLEALSQEPRATIIGKSSQQTIEEKHKIPIWNDCQTTDLARTFDFSSRTTFFQSVWLPLEAPFFGTILANCFSGNSLGTFSSQRFFVKETQSRTFYNIIEHERSSEESTEADSYCSGKQQTILR